MDAAGSGPIRIALVHPAYDRGRTEIAREAVGNSSCLFEARRPLPGTLPGWTSARRGVTIRRMTDRIAPHAAVVPAACPRLRGPAAALLFAIALAACAAEPPSAPAEPTPPPPPPVGWAPIPSLTGQGDIASGFVQERGLITRGPVRRAWILLNLREPIPIPETGGRAQSVRFVAEYRCAERQWRPLEGAWFARPNAQEPVHAERSRRPNFQPAAAGTLGGSFLDAACSL